MGHTTGILMRSKEEALQVLDELHYILRHKICQLNMYVLPIHLLQKKQKGNKNYINLMSSYYYISLSDAQTN